MSWRNITVDGKYYRWMIGRSNVVVREVGKSGKKVLVKPNYKVAGFPDWESWERACWKGYASLTPKMIAGIIKAHNLGFK